MMQSLAERSSLAPVGVRLTGGFWALDLGFAWVVWRRADNDVVPAANEPRGSLRGLLS